jgi:hypothetical protein
MAYSPAALGEGVRLASEEEVELVMADLVDRLHTVDLSLRRALLPARRTIEADVTDLGLTYHTFLRDGSLGPVQPGAFDGRPDIWVATTSDDLVALARGHVRIGDAYASGRVKVDAPMMDLLRLRGMW